jgi:CBS domain-containing protein
MMRDEDVGSIPVVENDKLVGIVTDRDLALMVLGEQRPFNSPVRDYMTNRPETASPDTTIHQAAQTMQTHQIRRLPIVEGDRLVGIISLGDLAVETQSDDLKVETLEEVSTPTKQ